MILGIDPGLSSASPGAIAHIGEDGQLLWVHTMPIVTMKRKNGKNYSAPDVRTLTVLLRTAKEQGAKRAYIEEVSGHGMGAMSAFNFGVGFGACLGVLAALGLDTEQVLPTDWMHAMGVKGKKVDPQGTLQAARALWPSQALEFQRQKDNGKADASLIGAYGWAMRPSIVSTHHVNQKRYG